MIEDEGRRCAAADGAFRGRLSEGLHELALCVLLSVARADGRCCYLCAWRTWSIVRRGRMQTYLHRFQDGVHCGRTRLMEHMPMRQMPVTCMARAWL